MAHHATRRELALTWMSRSALAAAIGTLAACGGGGGGSSEPTVTVPTGARTGVTVGANADLTAANYTSVSAPLVRAVANGAGESVLDLTQGAPREQAQVAARAAFGGGASPWMLTRLAQLAMSVPIRERAAASGSETVACDNGGTLFVSVTDADNNNVLSGGDTIAMTATNCVLAAQPAANGSLSMTINAVDLDSANQPEALDVTAAFNSFQVAGYGSMTGGFRLWARSSDANNGVARVSYLTTLVAEANASTVKYDFDVYTSTSAGVATYEVSGGIEIAGQTYLIERDGAFIGTPPTVGAVRLKDATGDFVKLVARTATTFDLEFYDAASSTTNPATSTAVLAWANYKQ